jgi:hypothetical protein
MRHERIGASVPNVDRFVDQVVAFAACSVTAWTACSRTSRSRRAMTGCYADPARELIAPRPPDLTSGTNRSPVRGTFGCTARC